MDKINQEIAELAGIFAADGCMQKRYICFWGNITEDKDYYNNVIKNLFQKAFNIIVNPHEKKSNSVYGFYICKKEIIEFFNKYLGFKPGSKTYTVRVPKIIMKSNNPQLWSAFIRGFCDCDGNLNCDKRRGTYQEILKIIHTYPRIQLKSVSYNIIKDISTLLIRLNIKHTVYKTKSKKENEKDCNLIEIRGKKRVEEWMKIIGFNNPVQITRYRIFKKYGFVPVNTSLVQRKAIIEGNINPWNFYPKETKNLNWIR